jgi:hypothetical protein
MDSKSRNDHSGIEEQLSESDEPDPDEIPLQLRLGRFIVEEILDNNFEPRSSNVVHLTSVSSMQKNLMNHRILSENINYTDNKNFSAFIYDNTSKKFVNAESYFNSDTIKIFKNCKKIYDTVKKLESWNTTKFYMNESIIECNTGNNIKIKVNKNQNFISPKSSPSLKKIIDKSNSAIKVTYKFKRDLGRLGYVNNSSTNFSHKNGRIDFLKNYLRWIDNSFSLLDNKSVYKTQSGTFLKKDRKYSTEKTCETNRKDFSFKKLSEEFNLEKDNKLNFVERIEHIENTSVFADNTYQKIEFKKDSQQIEYFVENNIKVRISLEIEKTSSFTIQALDIYCIKRCGKIICLNCLSSGNKLLSDI